MLGQKFFGTNIFVWDQQNLLSVTYDPRKLYLKLIDNFTVLILMRKKFQQVLSTNCKISAVFFIWLTIVNKNSVSR